MQELLDEGARRSLLATEEACDAEPETDGEPAGAEDVDGEKGEQAQQLLAEEAVEEVRHRRAVVRRRDGDYGANR